VLLKTTPKRRFTGSYCMPYPFQQFIDGLGAVQRIIHVEQQFRHHPHLLADAPAQLPAQTVRLAFDHLDHRFLVLHREEAQVHFGDARGPGSPAPRIP
jgi:hypothetical protein